MLNSDENLLNSDESLSMLSLPDYNTPEVNAIPLWMECWQDICLSKIWIHKRYLPSMNKALNTKETRGVYGTLQKWGDQQKIKSFSVYSDSDIESESDDQSDSDEDLDTEKTNIEDDSKRILSRSRSIANLSEIDSLSLKSSVSLNEILDTTTDADICKFELIKSHNHEESSSKENTENLSKLQSFSVNNEPLNQGSTTEASIEHSELEKLVKYAEPQGKEALKSSKKNRNLKKKNKVVKSVTLDKFLEDYTDEDRQVACANNYLQRILRAKDEDCLNSTKVHFKNSCEFPELTSNLEIENQKVAEEKPAATIKRISETLPQSDDNENIYSNQTKKEEPTLNTVGKFIIENIPAEVSHGDIYSFFRGYGELKEFSVEKDGNFQKAVVQIDLMCDGDWIVECLNGTEPFGASSRALKCYMQ